MEMLNQIVLDSRIYPIYIITKAMEDYRKIAEISYEFNNDTQKVILDFKNFPTDFQIIKDEFCNYLIELISTGSQGA